MIILELFISTLMHVICFALVAVSVYCVILLLIWAFSFHWMFSVMIGLSIISAVIEGK